MQTIALIAHDLKKDALAAWAKRNEQALGRCALVATGSTGAIVMQACPTLDVRRMKSGPLGGDQQIGALIAEGAVDALIFFPDPLTPMPHDVDVKALLRLALVYDTPCAFNPRTADLLVQGGVLASSAPLP
ncbi:MAG TPA: methylglyoxal synthase [Rhodoblastus sp.]|nr:methylglyoxal synthase [Rhodoblastus sp.]